MRLKTPIIKNYFCIDIEDIDRWEPKDREYVDFWFDIYVEFDKSEYSDNYQLHVVTEK